jgi:hypothetical protein
MTFSAPLKPRWEDFLWELRDSNGVALCALTHLVEPKARTIPGATTHRLDTASFSLPVDAPEAAYFDAAVIQFVSITPYGQDAHSLWGIISKPKWGYGERGRRDYIDVTVIGVEYLLHSRECYNWTGGVKAGISAVSGKADDLAKEIVRQVFDDTDADGHSRAWNWGTLAVAADTGATTGTIEQALIGGYVDDNIKALCKQFGFNYELRPSVTGGAVTFTFTTSVPDNGLDKTEGNGVLPHVVVNDFGGQVPKASRYRDWQGMANAVHNLGCDNVVVDAASIATWGRWEYVSEQDTDIELQMEMANLAVKAGEEYTFNVVAASGQCNWLEHYIAGDLVTRNNFRLGIVAASEVMAAITLTWPDKFLSLEVQWGDKEPGASDKSGGGKYRGHVTAVPDYRTPVAVGAANAEGDGTGIVRDDHVHKFALKVGDTEAPPTDGVITLAAGANIALSPRASTITISATGVASSSHTHDHGALTGLADDDHTQYFLLAGETDDAHLISEARLEVHAGDAAAGSEIVLDPTKGVLIHDGKDLHLYGAGDYAETEDGGKFRVQGTSGNVHTLGVYRVKTTVDNLAVLTEIGNYVKTIGRIETSGGTAIAVNAELSMIPGASGGVYIKNGRDLHLFGSGDYAETTDGGKCRIQGSSGDIHTVGNIRIKPSTGDSGNVIHEINANGTVAFSGSLHIHAGAHITTTPTATLSWVSGTKFFIDADRVKVPAAFSVGDVDYTWPGTITSGYLYVTASSTTAGTVSIGALSSIDHGGLAGLGDDDHTQYLNTSRHAAIVSASDLHYGKAAVSTGAPGTPFEGEIWLDTDAKQSQVAQIAEVWFAQ